MENEYHKSCSNLGDYIAICRKQEGMNQKTLACKSQLCTKYISKIETGQANMTLAVLARVAKGLGKDIVELVEYFALEKDAYDLWKKQTAD